MTEPQQQQTATAQPSPFVHRAIRIVAMVLLAYASLHVLQYLLFLVIEGGWWRHVQDGYRWAERAVQLSRFGTLLLLLAGSVGLLKWKPWSRPAVILWAVLTMVIGFASGLPWLLQYAREAAASTQPVYQPVWQVAVWTLFSTLSQCFFPLLVLLLLRQPEVATLFVRPREGGFEVVPFAQAAGDARPPAAAGTRSDATGS